jgi:hypothetical protein
LFDDGRSADQYQFAKMSGRGDNAVMAMEAHAGLMSAEELERLDIPGKWTELVRGQLIVRESPSAYHGHVAGKLFFLLGQHVYPRNLGWLFGQDTGFRIASNPDTVRAPDVAFTSRERVPVLQRRGYGALRRTWLPKFFRRTTGQAKCSRRSATGSRRV